MFFTTAFVAAAATVLFSTPSTAAPSLIVKDMDPRPITLATTQTASPQQPVARRDVPSMAFSASSAVTTTDAVANTHASAAVGVQPAAEEIYKWLQEHKDANDAKELAEVKEKEDELKKLGVWEKFRSRLAMGPPLTNDFCPRCCENV